MLHMYSQIATILFGMTATQSFANTTYPTSSPIPSANTLYTVSPSTSPATSSPGHIFKSRSPCYEPALNVNNHAKQTLCRTINSLGTPRIAVSPIVNKISSTGNRLVAYLPFKDAAYGSCAPSYQFPVSNGTSITINRPFANEISNEWTVVIPGTSGNVTANWPFAYGIVNGWTMVISEIF
jgi:hypothetical protein